VKKKKKKKTPLANMNKPLVQMNELELMRTFDAIGGDINDAIMKQARNGAPTDPVLVAALVLVKDGVRRCVSHSSEYGDGAGVEMMEDLRRQLIRTNKIANDERLELVVLEKPLDQFQWRFA